MRGWIGIAAVVLALASAGTAAAQQPSVQSSEAAARIAPDDGGASIELANAYWRTGRIADAYTAYRRALTLGNVMLETPQGDAIWSHEVARRALARQVMLSAR